MRKTAFVNLNVHHNAQIVYLYNLLCKLYRKTAKTFMI